MQHIIQIMRDDEAGVYTGTCETVRGLVIEERTIEDVITTATALLPEMVAANAEYELSQDALLFQLTTYNETRIH